MKVTLGELNRVNVTKVVIESVDLSLYIALARIGGKEHVITDSRSKTLKTRNLLDMRSMLCKLLDCEFFLRHRSAYDEMLGHHYKAGDNCMELPLGREPLSRWLD